MVRGDKYYNVLCHGYVLGATLCFIRMPRLGSQRERITKIRTAYLEWAWHYDSNREETNTLGVTLSCYDARRAGHRENVVLFRQELHCSVSLAVQI